MHQTKIISDIIKQAESKGKVAGIVIEVGQLASVEADHLKEHLEERVDWDIEVREVKAKVKCKCGYEGEPDIMTRGHDFVLFTCPWCGDVPEVEYGNEIVIKEVKCA